MRCVWASIDENGHARGGKAGNQTGKELRFGAYYEFGQKYLIRAKDKAIPAQIAAAASAITLNRMVGYDQSQRTTLFEVLEKKNWDAALITKYCECDCSELAVCAINCAYGRELLSADTYSGNIASRAVNTGLFDRIPVSKAVIHQGDIIIAPGKHVIIAVGTLIEPAKQDKSQSYMVGKTYTTRGELYVRHNAGKNQKIKKVKELTADGQKNATHKKPDAQAVLRSGTRVTCKEIVKTKSGQIWLRIPSGYICAFNGVNQYVY